MLQRPLLEQTVRRALGRSRGVVLVGPRQSGKSTLAQQFLQLGSASPSLQRQAGESLLGSIETIDVNGFDL